MALNKFSRIYTQDDSLPASQAMLIGAGLSDADLRKPFVGICSTGFEGNTCNMHLDGLADEVSRRGSGNVDSHSERLFVSFPPEG